jgi:hypothetical protein
LRRVFVFGPLACLDVLSRLDVGLRCYGKARAPAYGQYSSMKEKPTQWTELGENAL